MRAVRAILAFLCWTLVGLTLGLAVALSAPAIAGYSSLTVLSGSMEPTLHVGSVVLSEAIPATEARPGQIVTFRDASRNGELVSHRLVRMAVHGGVAEMVTRGDANTASEEWSVPANGTVGLVQYRIPLLGYLKAQLDERAMRLGLLLLVALSGLLVVVEIWRPKRPPAAGVTGR